MTLVRLGSGLLAGALSLFLAAGPAAAARSDHSYDLPAAGTYLEGIGVDKARGYVYVSATNRDGAIYRGKLGSGRLTEWVAPRTGDNGRGVTVDKAGRVYVAGGPSAEVRVFSPSSELLAELPTGRAGSFLNDVWIGPDGAAYVTDSSLPVIWKVWKGSTGWEIAEWLDVSAAIAYTPSLTDFDLGGIVSTPGGRYLLLGQGTTGQLWRVDLRSKAISEIPLPGGAVVTADGLALRGHTLVVVQNFQRKLTVLELDDDWAAVTSTKVIATDPGKTFTTADFARGRLLAVDAHFGFPVAPAADRVVPFRIG